MKNLRLSLLIPALLFVLVSCKSMVSTNVALEHFRKGQFQLNLEEYDLAVSEFTKSIELNPNFADAYERRGLAYFKMDMQEEAEQDFAKAKELKAKKKKL